jgi:hypothetical protein
VLDRNWSKSIFLANRIAPDTTSLIRHAPRQPHPLRLPSRSHIIYHQATVDRLCAHNSLRSLAAQLPPEDEIVILDVGGTAPLDLGKEFADYEWYSLVRARAAHPEQQSYTFGLNCVIPGLKASIIFVWRTDYVYPPDLLARYEEAMRGADFAAPYEVLVGAPEVDSEFVAAHWDKIAPYETAYWSTRAQSLSIYEQQDPALFCISRAAWDRIGGLNHQLWGYGWQFAEFAARVRLAVPAARVRYFGGTPALHQTHAGSQMHQPADRRAEAEAGIQRFTEFLGGTAAYRIYRLRQRLPPIRHVP